jgi:hypothetical protein
MTQQQQTTQTAQLGEMLTLEQQFCQELRSLLQLDDEQEHILIERARSGDTAARNELILSLIPSVKAFVHRFLATNYENVFSQWEVMDLVQEGAKAMLEAFERVRPHQSTLNQADNPCAFLLVSAYGTIRGYCRIHHSSIHIPNTPGLEPFLVDSLDAALPYDETKTVADLITAPEAELTVGSASDCTPLSQAIEQLTPRRREIVIRSYGLYGHAPERLCELAQSLSGDAKRSKTTCHEIRVKPLGAMRQQLQEIYPQYGTDSLKLQQRYASERLTLSDARRKALREAEARLEARGERVTRCTLAREARMDDGWAALSLREYPERQSRVSESARQARDLRLTEALAHVQARGELISVRKLAREAKMAPYPSVHTFLTQQALPSSSPAQCEEVTP